jgi:hypothetical protein
MKFGDSQYRKSSRWGWNDGGGSKAWHKKNGDVFSLYFGGQLVVVLNGYDVIKEARVKMADVFNHRPYLYTIHKVIGHNGR